MRRRAGLLGGIRFRAVAEQLRASLWFVPTVFMTVAVVTAAVLNGVRADDGSAVSDLVFPGGADSARAILQAIAGSVITVTGVVFSLTVVTLQLASTQFSPRLLRTFLRDVSNQVVLGIFLATFSYALVVLRGVRSASPTSEEVVPAIGVTGAYVLAAASVLALVYFIDHIARSIRIDSLMREVNEDTRGVIDRIHPERVGTVQHPPLAEAEPPRDALVIDARRSGFLQGVDHQLLLEVAVAHDAVIVLEKLIGDRVIEGRRVALVWGRHGGVDQVDDVADTVAAAVTIGYERTLDEDIAFGLRQLVDVAVKALSPGVNDPTTAVHALAHLTALLVVLAERDLSPRVRRDDGGEARVVIPALDLGDYVELACGQIRRYGSAEPAVTTELLRMLHDLARCDLTRDEARAVLREADLVLDAAERDTSEPRDAEPVRKLHAELRSHLSPHGAALGDLREDSP